MIKYFLGKKSVWHVYTYVTLLAKTCLITNPSFGLKLYIFDYSAKIIYMYIFKNRVNSYKATHNLDLVDIKKIMQLLNLNTTTTGKM